METQNMVLTIKAIINNFYVRKKTLNDYKKEKIPEQILQDAKKYLIIETCEYLYPPKEEGLNDQGLKICRSIRHSLVHKKDKAQAVIVKNINDCIAKLNSIMPTDNIDQTYFNIYIDALKLNMIRLHEFNNKNPEEEEEEKIRLEKEAKKKQEELDKKKTPEELVKEKEEKIRLEKEVKRKQEEFDKEFTVIRNCIAHNSIDLKSFLKKISDSEVINSINTKLISLINFDKNIPKETIARLKIHFLNNNLQNLNTYIDEYNATIIFDTEDNKIQIKKQYENDLKSHYFVEDSKIISTKINETNKDLYLLYCQYFYKKIFLNNLQEEVEKIKGKLKEDYALLSKTSKENIEAKILIVDGEQTINRNAIINNETEITKVENILEQGKTQQKEKQGKTQQKEKQGKTQPKGKQGKTQSKGGQQIQEEQRKRQEQIKKLQELKTEKEQLENKKSLLEAQLNNHKKDLTKLLDIYNINELETVIASYLVKYNEFEKENNMPILLNAKDSIIDETEQNILEQFIKNDFIKKGTSCKKKSFDGVENIKVDGMNISLKQVIEKQIILNQEFDEKIMQFSTNANFIDQTEFKQKIKSLPSLKAQNLVAEKLINANFNSLISEIDKLIGTNYQSKYNKL